MHTFTRSAQSYPRNSPQAAGRIVALALISDGEIKATEWAMLNRTHAREKIGLSGREWHDVVEGLCKDLLATAATGAVCRIDRETLARWLTEVDDAEMRRLVVLLTVALVTADGQVDEAESTLLVGMLDYWALPFNQHVALTKLSHWHKASAWFEPMLYRLDRLQPPLRP